MSDSKPAAIIVFRHAHDLPTDAQKAEMKKYNDAHPDDKRGESYYYIHESKTYPLPDPSQAAVTLPWQRLSPDGFNEAKNVAADLPNWIAKHWASVNLVITKDPRSKDQTQNPFQTVIPSANALKASNKVEVQLKEDPGFDTSNLISDGHSAVICWDRQGLWQDPGDPAGTYILQALAKANPLPGNITRPQKAGTFYVFTNPVDGKYDITQYNYSSGTGFVKVG